MIEIYVLLTLSALGYLLNKLNDGVKNNQTDIINVNETPSMNNIYDSTYVDKADAILKAHATRKFEESKDPKKTSVISYNYHHLKDDTKESETVKSLTGEYISKQDFLHNNMVPFFGSSTNQNMVDSANRNILENFTGVTDIQKNKCEIKSFNDLTKNMTNVNGAQNNVEFLKDRFVLPTIRNNEFPIPQVHVGPGIGQGYTTKPTGGYQQFDIQDYAQDKCVDELRTKLNPNQNTALGIVDVTKQTYKSRTVDGIKTKLRGDVGKVAKNRVETSYEQTPDMLLKTTGANLKPTKHGEWTLKDQNRLTTTKPYIGAAQGIGMLARTTEPNVKRSSRQQFDALNLGIASLDKYSAGTKDDYGKSKILVYNNERDITSTRVYQGNLTSLVKSIIAPLEDMIKITKKQHHVNNPRHFGNISMQIPSKQTVRDPNDLAKTTIKETTIHDALIGNLKGNEKITIYDPNDVARTTIKETLIHDENGTGTITGAKQLYVYDPDEIAKTTIRETVDRMDYEMNIASQVYKGTVYDPDEIARTTIKETTEGLEREFGNPDAFARGGGYETNDYDAKLTQKAFISDNDYFGTAVRDAGEGYITNEFDAKNTKKQFLSDNDYFGIANAGEDKKQMSYDDMYNATITEKKEIILNSREPTQTGSKVFNDCMNMAVPKKRECDLKIERIQQNKDRIYNAIPSLDDETITKSRINYERKDDRLDISILDAFRNNPYTQPLNSVA